MAGIRHCRVCGKAYTACHTPNPTGVFRWKDVACSLYCASEYLKMLEKAKQPKVEESDETETE